MAKRNNKTTIYQFTMIFIEYFMKNDSVVFYQKIKQLY